MATAPAVTITETDSTVTVSFGCPTCDADCERTLQKPLNKDARFSCQACQNAHYLFPVIGTREMSLDEMSLEEEIAYQLESIRLVEDTGRANNSMVTQSVKLLFPSTTGFLTAFFAALGFMLVSVDQSVFQTQDFWITFGLIGIGLGLGIASLVFGPPAYLKQLYDYVVLDDTIDGMGRTLRAIGNYHHVHPFVWNRIATLMFDT